jgi:hypothetical protein
MSWFLNGNSMKRIVVTIYTDPELYPPVLNAIDELSEVFEKVIVLSRKLTRGTWAYPNQVQVLTSGGFIDVKDAEKKSVAWKFKSFLRFTRDLFKTLKKQKPEWIMCNDPISLMSFRMTKHFLHFPVKLWYHSHDVAEINRMRSYSVGYFAVKSEKKHFDEIDLFTLPSESRLSYFPVDRLNGSWLIVPNFPSKRRNPVNPINNWKPGTDLKMIYQGRISNEHGLEEILDFIKQTSGILLTIIGPGDENYIEILKDKISSLGIGNKLEIAGPVAYGELRQITQKHHIGLAVNKPLNILYSTAAQASNKIYEYAASGLPVLYFKNEHYMQFLGSFSWAFPTDLTGGSLSSIIQKIKGEYQIISDNAIADFQNRLNFGAAFKPVISILSEKASDN